MRLSDGRSRSWPPPVGKLVFPLKFTPVAPDGHETQSGKRQATPLVPWRVVSQLVPLTAARVPPVNEDPEGIFQLEQSVLGALLAAPEQSTVPDGMTLRSQLAASMTWGLTVRLALPFTASATGVWSALPVDPHSMIWKRGSCPYTVPVADPKFASQVFELGCETIV